MVVGYIFALEADVAFDKFLSCNVKFMIFKLEELREVNLNQTSILLMQVLHNVTLNINDRLMVRIPQDTPCFHPLNLYGPLAPVAPVTSQIPVGLLFCVP